jgi:hypothetical protein
VTHQGYASKAKMGSDRAIDEASLGQACAIIAPGVCTPTLAGALWMTGGQLRMHTHTAYPCHYKQTAKMAHTVVHNVNQVAILQLLVLSRWPVCSDRVSDRWLRTRCCIAWCSLAAAASSSHSCAVDDHSVALVWSQVQRALGVCRQGVMADVLASALTHCMVRHAHMHHTLST